MKQRLFVLELSERGDVVLTPMEAVTQKWLAPSTTIMLDDDTKVQAARVPPEAPVVLFAHVADTTFALTVTTDHHGHPIDRARADWNRVQRLNPRKPRIEAYVDGDAMREHLRAGFVFDDGRTVRGHQPWMTVPSLTEPDARELAEWINREVINALLRK